MRTLWIVIGSIMLAFVLGTGGSAAETFKPTIYSDGYSCPNNCDSHVVFHPSHNGTKYASLPSSTRLNPAKCKSGEPCRICFGDEDSSCLNVVYRGNGPDVFRFDFTPAFYEEYCSKPDLPKPLVDECKSFSRQYARLIENKIYCLNEPENQKCLAVIAAAEKRKNDDAILWKECLALGEKDFNKKYSSDITKQRKYDCAYEKKATGGPHGNDWSRLLPAACQSKAYVGKDGLDCCDANKMSLGGLGKECSPFLVPKS
ncbi:MAG: hypothetical protein KDJ88_05980 [Bauldia sp.]|nr:hypothetical protein [Bauldia sp.]